MQRLLAFGKGKLTYALAFVALVWAVVGYLFFNLDGTTAMAIIWSPLAVFGIRRAM